MNRQQRSRVEVPRLQSMKCYKTGEAPEALCTVFATTDVSMPYHAWHRHEFALEVVYRGVVLVMAVVCQV